MRNGTEAVPYEYIPKVCDIALGVAPTRFI